MKRTAVNPVPFRLVVSAGRACPFCRGLYYLCAERLDYPEMAVESYITLSQLQGRIEEVLCGGFPAPLWITAEIGEMKVNTRSGHCYLQLVEKGGRNGVPQAQAQAVIWAGRYGMLSSFFRGATGAELGVGMKVLLSVTVAYHELYGLSLQVTDIDPLYTLGDLAQQRMQTIARLKEDGVFDLNRELGIPEVPQRIAVVSSPQAAGYQDFMKELGASPYRFDTMLFGAVMQGHGAEQSIIEALEAVADAADRFDALVVIRGGGSQSDLSFLNSYLLGFHVAQFPLPVIAGLGHDKDQSVVDMVAALSLKTPTAVAGFLVERAAAFDGRLEDAAVAVANLGRRVLDREEKELHMCGALLRERVSGARFRMNWKLESLGEGVVADARRALQGRAVRLDELKGRLAERACRAVAGSVERLAQSEKLLAAADPRTILARGFAVVRAGGRALTDAADAEPGMPLDITLYKGTLTAKVTDHGKK